MAPDSAPDARTAELYVQSLTPSGCNAAQAAVLRRLDRLVAADALADRRVVVWGTQVGLSTTAARTDPGRYVLDRVAECKNWALSNNVSVGFLFSTREVCSAVTGEAYTALSLPAMVLAEFEGRELVHVTPHRDGGDTVTVRDRLQAIESDGTPGDSLSRDAEAPTPRLAANR